MDDAPEDPPLTEPPLTPGTLGTPTVGAAPALVPPMPLLPTAVLPGATPPLVTVATLMDPMVSEVCGDMEDAGSVLRTFASSSAVHTSSMNCETKK